MTSSPTFSEELEGIGAFAADIETGNGLNNTVDGTPTGPTGSTTSQETPDPQFLLQILIPPNFNPSDIGEFTNENIFKIGPGTFPKPVQFQWIPSNPLKPAIFNQMDEIDAEWIVNLNGSQHDVTGPSSVSFVPTGDTAGTRGSLTLEINPNNGQGFDGLDMFIVLKYPDLTNPNVAKIVQVSPLFTVTSNETKSQGLRGSYASRLNDDQLSQGFTLRDEEGLSYLPEASVCNPLDTNDKSCEIPDSFSNGDANGSDGSGDADGSSANPTAISDASYYSHGGLSTAAKAGIGVGAGIAALAFIGLVAFLLFRRRQRRRADHVHSTVMYDAPTHGGAINDYMTDKEMSGPRLAESPYSEDDGRGSALLSGSHRHTGEFQNQSSPRGFAPYSDAPPHAVTTDTRVESQVVARSLTPERAAVPSSVAHLVEEGMTEDQIRRLEEEERALDQAIEQAGHTNR